MAQTCSTHVCTICLRHACSARQDKRSSSDALSLPGVTP